MRTLKILPALLSLVLSACMGTNVQFQTASVPELGRWLNGNTPVIMLAFASELADSAIVENQTGRMWRLALGPDEMHRYRVATTSSNGRSDKMNVLVRGYKRGRFIGYACNYYYLQGTYGYWGSGGNQPDMWFLTRFSKNPQCERSSGW